MDVLASIALSVGAVGALFLAASGSSKFRRPLATARALYAADLPSAFWLVRSLGALECVVGGAALVAAGGIGGVLWSAAFAAVAALYCAFAIFIAWALATQKPLGSCGCAGSTELPPSWVHVGANAVVAAFAAVAASVTARPVVGGAVGVSALRVGFLALAAYLAYVALLRTGGATRLRKTA